MNDFKFQTSQFLSPTDRELLQKCEEAPPLDAWRVQTLVYEILQNHFLTNNPKDLGFGFEQRYDEDETKSQIFIDLSHNWKASSPQKRPAVFVYRGAADYGGRPQSLGQKAFVDVAESTEGFVSLVSMPIMLNCIAPTIGFAESFANYVKYPFLYFWKNIQCEYKFRKFRLESISAPEQFTFDSKDAFSVKLTISTEFYDKWAIHQEALKFKTFSASIHSDMRENPLENQ